jgi:hypothetical protein
LVDLPLCAIERIEKLGGSKSRGDYGLEIICKVRGRVSESISELLVVTAPLFIISCLI